MSIEVTLGKLRLKSPNLLKQRRRLSRDVMTQLVSVLTIFSICDNSNIIAKEVLKQIQAVLG